MVASLGRMTPRATGGKQCCAVLSPSTECCMSHWQLLHVKSVSHLCISVFFTVCFVALTPRDRHIKAEWRRSLGRVEADCCRRRQGMCFNATNSSVTFCFRSSCWLPMVMLCRRAKRLRKIFQQLDSPIARAPLQRFWRGTWGVLGILLLAHVICYAVLVTTLAQRYT